MKKLLIGLCFLGLVSCTDSDSAINLLEANGYTDIEITGYDIFACSKNDFYHTGFRAKTMTGKEIEGTVCKGLIFRGSTIRFDD